MSSWPPIEPLIAVVPLGESALDIFQNENPVWDLGEGVRSIFGGFLVGHSVAAAKKTVPATFQVHSLQSVFVKPGNPRERIMYRIERILDGRTLATRLVRATQGNVLLFHATIGFQRSEDSGTAKSAANGVRVLEYDMAMPQWATQVSPEDESLGSGFAMFAEMGVPQKSAEESPQDPLEWRHLPGEAIRNPTEFRRRSFVRIPLLSTDDHATHLTALAWMSDA
ncbi:hypothetical protein JX265_008832 [Neoarthrinium moseri]|uniref:Acyl-CoA thioesterase-like N-terminal HotDog domain-containing protein n=2 Tax=Neoarthrinium moseri TaxID=1658444 RepID=A0A9Q0AM99_9PEZI|nr:hypothetical protein JX265_008832 [Neoarthrinium moseri]